MWCRNKVNLTTEALFRVIVDDVNMLGTQGVEMAGDIVS